MNRERLEDRELIERCLETGDDRAWQALVERYGRLVYSVPLRMGLPAQEADEVFQDTFIRLLEKLATVRDRDRLGLWLAATARRKALDRATRGPTRRETFFDEHLPAVADPMPLAADELVRLEQQAQVRHALDQLAERCRRLLEALFYEDPPPSYRALARRLGVAEGSLGPTRRRCFDKLERILRPLIGERRPARHVSDEPEGASPQRARRR